MSSDIQTLHPTTEQVSLDPRALLNGYRQWTRPEVRRGSAGESNFRRALLALRQGVRAGPVFQASSLPPLVPPRFDEGGLVSAALKVEFWRRQSVINGVLAEMINAWPRDAGSPAAAVRLQDEVDPLLRAWPIAGPSHRSAVLVRTALRLGKSASAITVALRFHREMAWIWRANELAVDAMRRLLKNEPPREEFEAQTDALLAHAGLMPRRNGFGFDRQMKFSRDVLHSLASLLLPGEALLDTIYPEWHTKHEAARAERATTRPRRPERITVLLLDRAAENPTATLASVRCQPGEWECLTLSSHRSTISGLTEVSAQDLPHRATGDLVLLVAEPAVLAPFALEEFLHAASDTKAELLYSDHDHLTTTGRVTKPFFKPGWSPDLFNEVQFAGELIAIRKQRLLTWLAAGGTLDRGAISRLLLSAAPDTIARVPEVLWHRTSEPDEGPHLEAVREHLAAEPFSSRLERHSGRWRVRRAIKGRPLVSIIVPFRDRPELLDQLLTTFERHERYQNVEFVLVSNNSKNGATRRFLETLRSDRNRVVEWNHKFNYQALNNAAVRNWARGEFLLFLNNDVSWNGEAVEEMLSHAQRPEIGAVGVNLMYPNGRIQHAGVAVGIGGFAAHPFAWCRPTPRWTAFGLPSWTRNPTAVTAACLMMRRRVFDEVKGFDESFVVSGGDVDLCLRVVSRGYRLVNTPHVSLTHHESATRSGEVIPDGDAWLGYARMHPFLHAGDPGYNPNLTLVAQDCLPRLDPRPADELSRHMLTEVIASSRQLLRP
ncbi:MAG: glycosyltransferase [Myxococcota bacterium]